MSQQGACVQPKTITADGAQGSGAGFFFFHKVGEHNFPFVVTNKHVVIGMREGILANRARFYGQSA
jgi:hypothetical protein